MLFLEPWTLSKCARKLYLARLSSLVKILLTNIWSAAANLQMYNCKSFVPKHFLIRNCILIKKFDLNSLFAVYIRFISIFVSVKTSICNVHCFCFSKVERVLQPAVSVEQFPEKGSALWACLAAMAVEGGNLIAAQASCARIVEINKVNRVFN